MALTPRRVNVTADRVLEHLLGRRPSASDRLALRLAVLRLEGDGLVTSDRELRLEATPDGHIAVELLRARRRHSA